MGVSKNRGVSPKMDGENNGKPYSLMDDLGVPLFSETSVYSAILKVDILLRCLHVRQWNFHITVSDLLNRQYEFIMIDLECPRSLLFLAHAYLRTQVQLVCREASMSPMRRSLLGTGNQSDAGSSLLWLGFPNYTSYWVKKHFFRVFKSGPGIVGDAYMKKRYIHISNSQHIVGIHTYIDISTVSGNSRN